MTLRTFLFPDLDNISIEQNHWQWHSLKEVGPEMSTLKNLSKRIKTIFGVEEILRHPLSECHWNHWGGS